MESDTNSLAYSEMEELQDEVEEIITEKSKKEKIEEYIKAAENYSQQARQRLDKVYMDFYKTTTERYTQKKCDQMLVSFRNSALAMDLLAEEYMTDIDKKEERRRDHAHSILLYFDSIIQDQEELRKNMHCLFLKHFRDFFDKASGLASKCEASKEQIRNYHTEVLLSKLAQHKPLYITNNMWSKKISEEISEKHRIITKCLASERYERISGTETQEMADFLQYVLQKMKLLDPLLELEKAHQKELAGEIEQRNKYKREVKRLENQKIDREEELNMYAKQKAELEADVVQLKQDTLQATQKLNEKKEMKKLIQARKKIDAEIRPGLQVIDEIHDLYAKCLEVADEEEVLNFLQQNLKFSNEDIPKWLNRIILDQALM